MQLNLVRDEGGEWDGLYIDGVLQLEGHSLEVREVLEYIVAYLQEHKSIPTIQFSAETVKMDPYEFSRMPNEYKDLKIKVKMNDESIPINLDLAVERLKNELDTETINYIKRNGYITLHHGLGTSIRNKWGLWTDSVLANWFKTNLGISHADDMSGIILETLYRDLNNKPRELVKLAQKYKDYWKKSY